MTELLRLMCVTTHPVGTALVTTDRLNDMRCFQSGSQKVVQWSNGVSFNVRVCLAFRVWCQWYLRAVRLVRNVRDVRNVRNARIGTYLCGQRAIVSLEVRRLVRCSQCERFFLNETNQLRVLFRVLVNLCSAKRAEQTPDPSGLSSVATPSLDLLHGIINQLTDTLGALHIIGCRATV